MTVIQDTRSKDMIALRPRPLKRPAIGCEPRAVGSDDVFDKWTRRIAEEDLKRAEVGLYLMRGARSVPDFVPALPQASRLASQARGGLSV